MRLKRLNAQAQKLQESRFVRTEAVNAVFRLQTLLNSNGKRS